MVLVKYRHVPMSYPSPGNLLNQGDGASRFVPMSRAACPPEAHRMAPTLAKSTAPLCPRSHSISGPEIGVIEPAREPRA